MNSPPWDGKNHNFDKTYPGCLGRMSNLFELNLGMSSNRLLTEKPHREGYPLTRSRSDVSRMTPLDDQLEDKGISSELMKVSSNRKSSGTPIKMLIAEEMSKEVDSQQSTPNLVAKLMGLDALPRQEPKSVTQRSHGKGHPRSHSDIPMSYWEQQKGFFHYYEPNEFKEVHEICQQGHEAQSKGRHDINKIETRLALIHQKFAELKRLSMNEKNRQSKQFQETLEILSSNKDLFLKCPQEPNSMFSQHPHGLKSNPPPELKRITLLRPSKMMDTCAGAVNKDGEPMKRNVSGVLKELEKNAMECSLPLNRKNIENTPQSTPIVILKPNPWKSNDVRTRVFPESGSPRISHGEAFFGDIEDNENHESREVAECITQKMHEKLGRHRQAETSMSFVFSNGYAGDESSFNKSELYYVADDLSDSEVMSPVSRHSWDYVNTLGRQYPSTLSRASYSPESSVCREAKKRLSERWAMMTSVGSFQEHRHFLRNSTTLGEMLALSEAMNVTKPSEGMSFEEPQNLSSLLLSDKRTDGIMDNTPKDLLRSKSVPVSSMEFGSRLNIEKEAPEEERKVRNAKSSFRGKVSNLFLSRSKKYSKDKSLPSDTKDAYDSLPGEVVYNTPESLGVSAPKNSSPGLMEASNKSTKSDLINKQGTICFEAGLSVSKCVHEDANRDQPSPICVLDPTFEDDEFTPKAQPRYVKSDRQGRLNLIDISPPIESLARTLLWDDSDSVKESDEEQEWLFFCVEALLIVACLQDELVSNSFLARWHSPESPLDLSLRDIYIDLNDKGKVHETKQRQKISTGKLVFDCVNAVLVEISGYESSLSRERSIGYESRTLADEVWAQIKELSSSVIKYGWEDFEDESSLVLESMVRNEVASNRWIDHLRMEIDNFGKEVEGELMEELVQEVVVEFAGHFI